MGRLISRFKFIFYSLCHVNAAVHEILSGALAAFGKITFFDRIQRHAASGDANKNLDISLDVCDARGPKPKSRPPNLPLQTNGAGRG